MTNNYEKIKNPILNEILKELVINHMMDLIVDTNGNHVFQKILLIYPKDSNDFIYEELIKFCFDISKFKQGGCILGRAFDFANASQRKRLIEEILKNVDKLINDEYGNFIIQQIVFLKESYAIEQISKFFVENLSHLSKKKYSSNVIDKVQFILL